LRLNDLAFPAQYPMIRGKIGIDSDGLVEYKKMTLRCVMESKETQPISPFPRGK
jgi:hypothetical protein